jgi:hypothetical protein
MTRSAPFPALDNAAIALATFSAQSAGAEISTGARVWAARWMRSSFERPNAIGAGGYKSVGKNAAPEMVGF